MRLFLTGILAVLLLNACSDGGPSDMTQAGKDATKEGGDAASVEKPVPVAAVTTGDVEQKIVPNGTLAEDAASPSVVVNEMTDPRGKVNMVTVDVYQPFPEHLPLHFLVRSFRNWEETPVVFRGRVTIEGRPEELGQLQFVWGKDAIQSPQETTVDIMPALQPVPDSVLVVLRADALLLPAGTDTSLVNPATATAPEDQMTGLISNPIRINFHNEPAPGAATPAAVAPQTPSAPAQ